MAKIIFIDPKVAFADIFAAVQMLGLQSAAAIPGKGTMLVVDPTQEEAAVTLLKTDFGDAVTVYEAQVYVPVDWNAPGFVHKTLEKQSGDVTALMSSGLGLLVAS